MVFNEDLDNGLIWEWQNLLSKLLQKELSCAWYNADNLREMANDWDFFKWRRKRQSFRMKVLADFEKANGRLVICDFICPKRSNRNIWCRLLHLDGYNKREQLWGYR